MGVVSRFVGRRLIQQMSGGRITKPGKIHALIRLPVLLRLAYPLFRDERIPIWMRFSVLGTLAFIFSPLDIVGDLPVVGQLWDFTMAVVLLEAFVLFAPEDVVNEHIVRLGLEKRFPTRAL